jgi:hypothetical protein
MDVLPKEEDVKDSGNHARAVRPFAPLVIAAVVAIVGSLAFAGAASAAKIGSGEAKLTVKKSIVKKLKKADVKIKAQSPATKAGKVLTFPITGGDLSTGPYHPAGTASGNVTLGGGITFKGDEKQLKINALNAVFAAESRLEGSKGDVLDLVKLGTVSGDGLTITGAKGKTAKDLKKKIKRKFDVNLKKKTFGFFDVAAVKDPQTTINAGGEVALTFAPAALGQLVPEGPVAIAPATLGPPAPATLHAPITGGIFNTSTLFGEVESAGGVELTGCQGPSGANVTFESPTVLLDATPTLNVFSSITGGRVDIASLTLPTPPAVSGNAVTITDANVAINSTAVAALNGLCGTTFAPGQSLGTANAQFTIAG